MPISKKVLSVDAARRGGTTWLLCCWDDCESQGVDLHKVMVHAHARGYTCENPLSQHVWYVFCSERHRQLWLHGHHTYGRLPVGERGRII